MFPVNPHVSAAVDPHVSDSLMEQLPAEKMTLINEDQAGQKLQEDGGPVCCWSSVTLSAFRFQLDC